MAFLKVYVQGTERTVFLGDEPLVIGRDAQCDIPIPDHILKRHVPREHWSEIGLRDE